MELDAVPAGTMRQIVRDAVEEYIDWDLWAKADKDEAADKELLRKIADGKDAA